MLVGDNPASVSYVASKNQGAAEVGINSHTFQLPGDTPQDEVVAVVREPERRPARGTASSCSSRCRSGISEDAVINAIDPAKDVDGIHPANIGRLLRGEPTFKPATPAGVQQLLMRSGNDPAGKHVVICGRSNIVGKPLAAILMQKAPGANATVTVCHTRTRDLASFTLPGRHPRRRDGAPRGAITADMVREGTVVIDVGNNRIDDPTRKSGFRLVGDVDYDAVAEKATAITPVPGGVGPMTVTMLLYNTVLAAEGRFE